MVKHLVEPAHQALFWQHRIAGSTDKVGIADGTKVFRRIFFRNFLPTLKEKTLQEKQTVRSINLLL
jgi:hypothetical protein